MTAALALLLVPLGGCRADVLPYAREIEEMELMRTLGVDAGADGGLAVAASTGRQGGADGLDGPPTLAFGQADTLSAAVLDMQGEGDSYLYFGHVGQLLLGEELARRSARPALEYVLRDVEMRLGTELYLVREGRAGDAMAAAAEEGAAADRLEAMEDGAALLPNVSPRTVEDVLEDLARNGCSFAPAVLPDGRLTAAGYGVLKDGVLAGWTQGEAAWGINLILGRVEADVVEVELPGGETAALRVVEARTRVRPQFDGKKLVGVEVSCRVDANLAEGDADLADRAVRTALEQALARRETSRIRAALDLCRSLDADFLGLEDAAGLARPWKWAEIQRQWDLSQLELQAAVEATVERSYDAA